MRRYLEEKVPLRPLELKPVEGGEVDGLVEELRRLVGGSGEV